MICCPDGIAVSISAAAVAIAQGKTVDELSLLAVVFTQLGDTLATIAQVKAICESQQSNDSSDSNNSSDSGGSSNKSNTSASASKGAAEKT